MANAKEKIKRHCTCTLQMQKPRMTRLEVPILDLQLRCGETLLEISLWRDQVLCELHEGDVVVLSHLHGSLLPNGKAKFQSSNYTSIKVLMIIHLSFCLCCFHNFTHTQKSVNVYLLILKVQVEEMEPLEEEIEVVGVTDINDMCHILSSNDIVYKVHTSTTGP